MSPATDEPQPTLWPLMTLQITMMIVITTRAWINPPPVNAVTKPGTQRTDKPTAIVSKMVCLPQIDRSIATSVDSKLVTPVKYYPPYNFTSVRCRTDDKHYGSSTLPPLFWLNDQLSARPLVRETAYQTTFYRNVKDTNVTARP